MMEPRVWYLKALLKELINSSYCIAVLNHSLLEWRTMKVKTVGFNLQSYVTS